jgi:hypothetical protein
LVASPLRRRRCGPTVNRGSLADRRPASNTAKRSSAEPARRSRPPVAAAAKREQGAAGRSDHGGDLRRSRSAGARRALATSAACPSVGGRPRISAATARLWLGRRRPTARARLGPTDRGVPFEHRRSSGLPIRGVLACRAGRLGGAVGVESFPEGFELRDDSPQLV